jgi:hypothetical protein
MSVHSFYQKPFSRGVKQFTLNRGDSAVCLIGERERGAGYFVHFLHVPLDASFSRGYDK